MALNRKPPRTQAKKTPPPADPRAALVHALVDAGQVVASACGVCGGSVPVDDAGAIQTYREALERGHVRQERSWRFHRDCGAASRGGSAALLALALDPDARPVRVTQAHADVAAKLGAPLRYEETPKSSHLDRGRGAWRHVPRAEMEELRQAVARRHQELTEPVAHASGWPCAVCGRSHELVDDWADDRGRPACAGCSRLIERAKIPRNKSLEEFALDAARPLLPSRADLSRFGLARDMSSYRPLGEDERREPWAYVTDLPEVPLTTEERLAARLAELERRVPA